MISKRMKRVEAMKTRHAMNLIARTNAKPRLRVLEWRLSFRNHPVQFVVPVGLN